jgi:hypothetical protein
MKLNYKASNIARAERETGKKFFAVMSSLGDDMSIDDLLFLFTAGGGNEDDFDEVFAKGIQEVMVTIMDGINDAGFLGEKIDTAEIRKAMNAATKAASKPTALPTTGAKTEA